MLMRATARVSEMGQHELFDIGLVHRDLLRTAQEVRGRQLRRATGGPAGTDPLVDARTLVKCSVFLHIAYIGAATLAGGLLLLFDAGAMRLPALVLTLCGGVLAIASWRRARSVLEPPTRRASNSEFRS
jgi:hypothetical protein